jgi:hypothetical protein
MTPLSREQVTAQQSFATAPSRAATALTALIAAAIGLIFLCGCSQFDIRKSLPWSEKEEEKFGDPSKVVVMWSDAVLNQPEHKGIRGFGGRLYYYGKDPNETIRVKGTLLVYGFDETDRQPNDVIPNKKFVFTPDQLPKHCSVNAVGPSYSIWIPWDDVEGLRKDVSLIARFTSEKGALVVSEQTKVALPGAPPPQKPAAEILPAALESLGIKPPAAVPLNAKPKQQFPGQQASYELPVAPATLAPEPIAAALPATTHKTTTIPVPASRLSRLRQNTLDDQDALTIAAQNLAQAQEASKSGAVGGIGTRGVAVPAPSSSQSTPDARFAPAATSPATVPPAMASPGINPPPFNPGTQAHATPGPAAAPVVGGHNWPASPAFGSAPVGWNGTAPWNAPAFGGGPPPTQPFVANPMGNSMPAQGLPPSQSVPPMQQSGSGAWNNPAAFSAPATTLMAPANQPQTSSF